MTTQGKRLKQFRTLKNLTQDDLGAVFNVSRQVVANLEADRILLNNDKLVSLCENFNLNISWLLCGIGNMFNQKSDNDIMRKVEELMDRKFKEKGL